MMRLLLRLVANAVALWVATLVVPGVSLIAHASGYVLQGDVAPFETPRTHLVLTLVAIAVVFTLVNGIVKPIVQLISLPFTVITLGLFLLVINAFMLMLTSWISQQVTAGWLNTELAVDGFAAAFWGGIVIGLVNWVLGMVVPIRGRR